MPEATVRLWEHPDVASTNIDAFRRLANDRHQLNLCTYHDIWSWSTEQLNDFWMLVWEFTKVKAQVQPTFAVSSSDVTRLTPTPQWFPEARLNFAQNILESPYAIGRERAVVLTEIREGGSAVEDVTLMNLRESVGRLANALITAGAHPGDRVACVGANSITTFAIFLATGSIGAIFTSCSPQMGEKGILDRFHQVRPTFLFGDDQVLYNGKRISCVDKLKRVAARLRSEAGLKDLIVVPRFGSHHTQESNGGFHTLQGFTADAREQPVYTPIGFNDPLIIVYSSGTTGPPKCIVHSIGGVLLKQKLEQVLCMNMKPSSTFMQYTTTNWIMYLYAVSGLLSGARSVLYDGSPLRPSTTGFLDLLSAQQITHFGTSAHYLNLLEMAQVQPGDFKKLEHLEVITSTGSVLTEAQYYWVYRTFGRVQLSSIAGGTDIAGAFVGGAPNLPVYAGWCQARTLGMKVQIYNEDGRAVESSGQPGELVCTAPFPSQPAYFWADKDGVKYRAAYFEKFAGIWTQGDYIQMEPTTQGIRFLGRSDGVLNPSGVRFGSAEIYNCLTHFPGIEDSLCIGQRRPSDRDERVLLFLKMREGHKCSQELVEDIKSHIRQNLSSRHIPTLIIETPEIPMTINGKKAELPVKKIVSGQQVVPSSTVANPEAFEWYKQFAKSDVPKLARL